MGIEHDGVNELVINDLCNKVDVLEEENRELNRMLLSESKELEEVKHERDCLSGKLEALEGELKEYKESNIGAIRNEIEVMLGWYDERRDDVQMMDEAMEKARRALDAPRRNCDIGNADEQAQRFYTFCQGHKSAIDGMCEAGCPCIDSGDECHCLCKWSQMPYEQK